MLREKKKNKAAKLLEIAVYSCLKKYLRWYNFGKMNIYITGKIVA